MKLLPRRLKPNQLTSAMFPISMMNGGNSGAQAVIVEKFSTLTGWTVVQGANSTVALSTGDGLFAPDCINFSSTAVAGSFSSITGNIEPDLDLSITPGFWLHARVNYRQTAVQVGISTYLSHQDNLGSGLGRWQATNLIYSTAVGTQPHWCPKTKFSVLDGSPTFTLPVKSWRYRLDSGAAEIHDWDLLGVTIRETARPCIVITQDDGWDTDYTIAFPACQARAIPQSHYLIPDLLGTAGYMTLTNAQEMRTAGDYLGLHGATRWDTDLPKIATDVSGLQALGIDTTHAAYPEGQIGSGTTWNDTIVALQAQGVKSARLAGGLTPTLRRITNLFCISSFPLNNTMTLAQAQAAVDTAIESNGTVFFYGHKYGAVADSLTWVTTDFTALLDYIVTKRSAGLVDTKTAAQWYGG